MHLAGKTCSTLGILYRMLRLTRTSDTRVAIRCCTVAQSIDGKGWALVINASCAWLNSTGNTASAVGALPPVVQ